MLKRRIYRHTIPADTTLNPESEWSFGIISESASDSVSIAIK